MNYISRSEKLLKHNLKKRRSITLSLIVSFLITGGLGFNDDNKVYARDLRSRNTSANEITPGSGGPNMTTSANGKDVINIVNPNSGGISHNKFVDFSVGTDGVIFNNNSTGSPVVTKIGGIVVQNTNLSSSASTILSEVTGNKGSNINGTVEIAGQRADFILANENGITVNGGGFINTNGVTLTTGRPTVSGSNIDLSVQKGNVAVESLGVGTAGDYFNIVAKTIELRGQVAAFDGEKDADITLIAGQNKVSLKDKASPKVTEVIGHDKTGTQYGIYASHLGSMYGRNIKMISTTEGLGVRHEGIVKAIEDISITSNGDITVGALLSEKSINVKGRSLTTTNGSYKSGGVESNYSLTATGGINIEVSGDIVVQSVIQAEREGIKIVGKNLTMKANTTAKILSQTGLVIKLSGDMDVEELLVPTISGRDTSLPPLVVLIENGKVVVKDPTTGKIIPDSDLTWETTGIFADNIAIEARNLINKSLIQSARKDTSSTINIKLTNQLTNQNVIGSSGSLEIDANRIVNEKGAVIRGASAKIAANNIKNAGELRQNTSKLGETTQRSGEIVVDIKNGRFENTGTLSGYNVKITGTGFILNDKDGKIIASTEDYPNGMGTISIDVKTLENKGLVQSYGSGVQNNITINTESLINHYGGLIIAQKGDLTITTTAGDLLNAGEFFADKNLVLKSAKGLKSTGKIGAENITIGADGTFENYGKIAAVKNLMITVNNLINAGSPEEIAKYLEAFNKYVEENYENVLKIIETLEDKLAKENDSSVRAGLEEVLSYYKALESELSGLNFTIEQVGNLGILSGENVNITTNNNFDNKGIIKATKDIGVTSGNNLSNSGVLEADNDITLSAKGDVTNSQRIYAKNNLTVTGKSFTSTGNDKLLEEYANLVVQFDENALKEAEDKIKELEKKLETTTDLKEIEALKVELKKYRDIKNTQAELKAKIITVLGLGIIEAGNVKITTTTGDITNNGIIVTDKDLTLDSGKNITNNGNIAVGGNATLKGQDFTNKDMSVAGSLNGTFTGDVNSESLKVQDDVTLQAGDINISKDLSVGGNVTINTINEGNGLTVEKDASANIGNDLTIKGGGLDNHGELVIGNDLNTTRERNPNANVTNTGSIDVGNNANINSTGFNNDGTFKANADININTNSGRFVNTNEIQSGNGANIISQGFINTGTAIFGGDVVIDAGTRDSTNNILEVSGNLTITTERDFVNTNKLQNTGKLVFSGVNITNEGIILNSGTDITAEGNLINKGDIETTGDLSLTAGNNLSNSGNIKGTENGSIKVGGTLENQNVIALGKNLDIEADTFINTAEGSVTAGNDLDVLFQKKFQNDGKIAADNILLTNKETSGRTNVEFSNDGKINANSNLTIDIETNQGDLTIKGGNYSANDKLTINNGGNILIEGKLQNLGSIDISSGKDLVNDGMIVSGEDVFLKAQNLVNEIGSTIWAGRNMVIDVINKIHNKLLATIESKADMSLTAGHILNDAGTIKAGGNLDITTDKLENISVVEGEGFKKVGEYAEVIKYKYHSVGIAKYTVIDLIMPIFESNMIVKDKATIQSGGNLTIKGKSTENADVHNYSGTITAKNDMTITGDLLNETASASMTAEEYLKQIQVVASWENRTLGGLWLEGKPTAGGTGSLWEVLPMLLQNDGGNYLSALKLHANENVELKKLLSAVLGPDWMDQVTIDPAKINGSALYQAFAANGSANILAGGNFTHSGGKFENIAGEAGGNKSVDVNIGDHTVDGVYSDLGVDVNDPNSVTEFGGVKQVHVVEIIKGQVTINGITISADSGGSVTIIAIAGTINPVIYIEIPVGDNGIFRPAQAAPGEKVPYKYETNIDFIDLDKYYGSDYFFKEAGYDSSKTSTVIGDAYYESELINRTIREGLGYSGEIGPDQIKAMLDNALSVKDELGLEIGMPLTPDQINDLEKDIIWYVEMEVDGDVVLVPQVYFGKETRLKMAESDQGGGTGSTVKAGGDINIDSESFNNTNGNISSGGNIDIKSEGDFVNNSSSGVNGGINGAGDVNVDVEGDINMSGGTIQSGGSVDVKAEGDINIESNVGFDKDGNQTVTNVGGILGESDVNIESGGDTTIKGGVVGSNEGDVNISGENVTIEDINITNSEFTQDSTASSDSTTSSSSSKSTGSSVGGKNVNIKAENDVTIKGSEVVAEEKLGIEAGNDVSIVDGQDYSNTSTKKNDVSMGSDGLIKAGSSSSSETTSKSKGSTVGGVEGVEIKSGGNTTIKGSDVIGGGDGISIDAGGDVNILDGQDTSSSSSNSTYWTGVGVSIDEAKSKSTTSKGSGLTSTGDINIKSGGDVKVVGSDITSIGDTNIESEGDVRFEAGKNTSESYSKSTNIGVTNAGASAGAGGASASAGWTPEGGATTDVTSGQAVEQAKDAQNMQSSGVGGKKFADSLANVTTTVGVSISENKEKSTTWTESEVTAGGNLNIKSKGTTDIGGADFTTGGDFNITADSIETTKYEDVIEKESSSISVGVKLDTTVTSGINDAVNQGMQIAEVVKDEEKSLNAGLTAGQVAGAVSSVIFGDLIGTTVSATADIALSKSKSKTTEENITEINSGGNVNFTTTGGDINLKGVDIKGDGDVTLDSAGDVNITDAKKTEQSSSSSTNVSGGVTGSTGVSIIDGGYAQAGVVVNVSHTESTKDNEYSQGSSITGNNITIKSKGDTNVIGSKVEGNNVNLEVGGDLTVETVTDKINEKTTTGQAGFDVSAGGATNTVVTGDVGLSFGGGTTHKSGEKLGEQAGIIAKDTIKADVKGDANIIGGSVGSESGEGSLNVGGDLNVKDVDANYKEGGEIINVSGGTKGGSVQGEIADKVEKDQTSKGTIGLNPGNVNVGGDVTVNGESGSINDVNSDLNDTIVTNKDEVQGGGTFGVQGSVVSKKPDSDGGTVKKQDDPKPPKKDDDDPKPPKKDDDDPKPPKKDDDDPKPPKKDDDDPKPPKDDDDDPKPPKKDDDDPKPPKDDDDDPKPPKKDDDDPKPPKKDDDDPKPPKDDDDDPKPPKDDDDDPKPPKDDDDDPKPPKDDDDDPKPPKDDDDNNKNKNEDVVDGGNGWKKVDGKWVRPGKDDGAVLTGGGLTNQGIGGFKEGVKDIFNKFVEDNNLDEPTVPKNPPNRNPSDAAHQFVNPGDGPKQPLFIQGPNGGWIKNPDYGKKPETSDDE